MLLGPKMVLFFEQKKKISKRLAGGGLIWYNEINMERFSYNFSYGGTNGRKRNLRRT